MMSRCCYCDRPIEPRPLYFTPAGEPKHMLCDAMTAARDLWQRALDDAPTLRERLDHYDPERNEG